MSEETIEREIQEKGLNAPRLCPKKIDAVIVDKTFTKLPSGKCMICELTLKNGFTVRGEAACVSPENFDQEIGEKVSFEDARNKIWQLEGYLLQEKHPVGGTYQDRVIAEKKELDDKLGALRLFIADDYKFLQMCGLDEQERLKNQENAMTLYFDMLKARVANFE